MSLRAKGSLWLARVLVGALLLGASAGALAQHCAAPAARAVSIQGSVEHRPHNAKQWQAAQSGIPICSGDSVRVGPRSRAALLLPNETTLRLDQGTTLTLSAPDQAQASLLDLILGTIHVISRTPRPFRVNTPYLNAGVEGTEFLVGSDEAGARLAVFEGRVSATSAEGALMLVGGEIAYAAKGAPLRKERMLRPADAVQWALYYPTLFDHRLGEQIAGTPGEAALRESIALYRQDRLAEAIFRLDKAPEGLANPRFLTYRAGLLLLVGRADEAGSDIERALSLDAANSNAHALKSVVALTQNDKDQALKLAAQAVELDPASPVARLALSYAQQAHFKIEEALASVQKAVDLDQQNALAWARLAELHMSTRYLDRALEAAKRAASLNPELAKTQSVLGFANLTGIDTQAAKQAFQKAVDLDQSDPLPRLGLGLAMIREGDLSAGREQLEVAVCLDPENSLLRSYVGKAYYEEKRDSLAGIQFDVAKERDPMDPTPWFYDAIRKQTDNRPAEALQDLRKSIELNNNRAVFRSRLLLDQDLASRLVDLARTYQDLGFQQLALLEASKAIIGDPSDLSAHQFLASSYATVPRHEIARSSEALQAQLRQPPSLTPLPQPFLTGDRFSFVKSPGLVGPSLNEYARVFDHNGWSLSGDFLIGDVQGSRILLTALRENLAFGFEQQYESTDGFRRNNDLDRRLSRAFLNAQFSASTTFQAQATTLERESGDLQVRFDPEFIRSVREKTRNTSVRLGARHEFSPEQELLISLASERVPITLTTKSAIVDSEGTARSAEIQYLLKLGRVKATAGVGALRGRSKLSFFSYPELLSPEFVEDTGRSHRNAYLYSAWDLVPSRLIAQIGVSLDRLREPDIRRNQTSPKLGLLWNPAEGTALRVAALRGVKRTFYANQTLEPTQMAGFNQFFDEPNGTDFRLVGLAIDQRLSASLYGGASSSRRISRYPVTIDAAAGVIEEFERRDRVHNAYLYWLINRSSALGVDYHYEKLVQPDDESFDHVVTHRLPVTLKLHWNPRLSFSLLATLVHQKGHFLDIDRNSFAGTSNVLLVDAAVTWRLPNRVGLLSIEGRNLFDRRFRYQETDPVRPQLASQRQVVARLSIFF